MQLLAAGFTSHMVQRRVKAGGLIPVHPGVYLVGHRAVDPLASETAAILACGPHALLSHHTAARLWKLPVPEPRQIQVTVVGRSRRSLDKVKVHTLKHLPAWELRRQSGLPLTSPSLTVLDLGGAVVRDELADALNEARVQRIVSDRQLHATLDAHPLRLGAKALHALVASERGPRIVRSRAEKTALRVLREHDLEPDESDFWIGPYRVDFLYRPERLVIEVDSWSYHSTPKRFVGDRRRTAYLAAQGYQLFPLTWDDLHDGREQAMRRLRRTREERGRLLRPPR